MKILCLCFLGFFFASCGPHFVIVKDEILTKQRLASTFAKSPDPERVKFREGRKLIVEWLLPYEERKTEDLKLRLHLVYGNLEQEIVEYPVTMWAGFITHLVLDPKFTENKGLMTYKADIINKEGNVIESFKQQLWVSIIDVKCRKKPTSSS